MACEHSKEHVALVVVGGGPGGYSAAFRAAELGLTVTVVDMQKNLGGTCLHCGCIPSKSLLHAAKILSDSREAKDIGIDFAAPNVDIQRLREWKNSVIQRLASGLATMAKQKKVNFLEGRAVFLASDQLRVDKIDGTSVVLTFDHAVIATGSQPANLPKLPASPRILNATLALDLENIPKNLLVVGGGYIGLELATVYAALGSEVSLVEMTPVLLAGVDRDLVSILERRLKKICKTILLETRVVAVKETPDGIEVTLQDKKAATHIETFEKILIAVGRHPLTQGFGLENTRVAMNDRGFIEVDTNRRTRDPKIFAVGDLVGNPMLAHKASAEGHVAAEVIAGKNSLFTPRAIPAVVFTDPEIAWCGLTEADAKEKNIDVKVLKMPWAASGRALTLNRSDGMTKILVDPKTEKILGVAIVGVGAGELISEGVLAIEKSLLLSDLKNTIHPHPTLSETLMDTAGLFYR